ncbi:PREDICTED: putative U-box domain-containing protein 50 isoform X2 [Tarenaya hassleriana]|uniref:putative U-box domain-containing protein 50 isoform X2 n=1 Tax=Tarenaya hassleriana TaxID=28532 RepID=UPI00053CA2E3|nr:PREDICTED: putative U-box domain-containing protein 50 isoform X2 [Tarenaya hassleriana]
MEGNDNGDRVEKVYVAVGNGVEDGFKTIDWALKKWDPINISIVILHISNLSNDLVYTPFGKLPASSVSEEKLQVLRKYEEEKVKAETLKVEMQDDPIQVLILDLISKLKITKLVMGITFMRSSSWKAKSAISGSFYVYRHKPEFCEFHIICGGKMVALRRDDDGNNTRNWFGKMFHDPTRNLDRSSSVGEDPMDSENPWDKNSRETDDYYHQLLSLNVDDDTDGNNFVEEEDGDVELDALQRMNAGEKMKYVKRKAKEAQEMIEQNKREAKANAERYAKAERAISLCSCRIQELETQVQEESERRVKIDEILETEKELLDEVIRDVQEEKAKLSSLGKLQRELSSKLSTVTTAKSEAETRLEKVVSQRNETVREMEKSRHQRDIFNRRIEFCKEREAIGLVSRLSYREYAAEDVRLATDDFSDRWRLKSGGNWRRVYRGRINHTTMAVKMTSDCLSDQDFLSKVELLNEIRHPHLVAIAGFCSEPKCILFEYMHGGNLRDSLFISQKRSSRQRGILRWHDRIRIAHQVCSGLGFLHSTKPKPIVHGHLTPSKILLDRNLVPKISVFGLTLHSDQQSDKKPDIRAFGILLLHLLIGRNWPGLLKAMTMNQTDVLRDLDEMAGKWPLELAKEVAALAMMCMSVNRGGNMDLGIGTVMAELGKIRQRADEFQVRGKYEEATNGNIDEEDPNDVPSVFLCPIFQEVMKNPHLAADGFSYEQEAIEEWLKMGNCRSPMTNLRLEHQFLTPNHTLRSLIQDWHRKRAARASSP